MSKYDGKLEKMAKVAAKAEMDFRNNLKRVQSTKFTMEEENKDVSKNVRVLGESLVVPWPFTRSQNETRLLGLK